MQKMHPDSGGFKQATKIWFKTLVDKSGLHTLPQTFFKTNAIVMFQANLPEPQAH